VPRERAHPGTVDGPLCTPRNRTTARRSKRPRHARGVGKGRAALGRREGTSEGARVARTSRRRTARARALWRAGARATSRRPEIVSDWPCSSDKNSIFPTKVHQGVNRKVVDLTTLYNFHKGSRVFFSTDFTGTSCQL
jgi:hypothetical protein